MCNSILGINDNIQSVVVINKFGRLVEKVTRNTSLKQLATSQREMFFMQCVLEISMGKDFDSEYGCINYHISERENLRMITSPTRDNAIVVKTNKNTGIIALATKIVTTIND